MEFGSLDGGEDGEHHGVGFVKISKISVTQIAFFFGTESFDRIFEGHTCAKDHGTE